MRSADRRRPTIGGAPGHNAQRGIHCWEWPVGHERRWLRCIWQRHPTSEAVAVWDAQDKLVAFNYLFEEIFGDISPIGAGITTFDSLIRLAAQQQYFRMAPNPEAWIQERLDHHSAPISQDILSTIDNRHFEIRERKQPDGYRLTLLRDITEIRHLEANAIHAELTEKRQHAVIAKVRSQKDELGAEILRREEVLALKERQISQFHRTTDYLIASLTRDLRNPLNAIISFADFISSEVYGPSGDARYKTYADLASNTGARLIEIMDQLSYLIEASSENPNEAPTQTTLRDLCVGAHESLAAKMDGVPPLQFHIPGGNVDVQIEKSTACTAIEYTLRGLLTQYTPESFKVSIIKQSDTAILALETMGQKSAGTQGEDFAAPTAKSASNPAAPSSNRSSAQLCFAIAETLSSKVNLAFTSNEVSTDSACARIHFPLP